MPEVAARSRVVTRTAPPDDLAAVPALVRQHRAEAHAEGALSGQTPGTAAAAGAAPAAAGRADRASAARRRHRGRLSVSPAG
jgi:hypothetical protein